MSKSLGNVVDPFELVETWGPDMLRYYLLKESRLDSDGGEDDILSVEDFSRLRCFF